MTVWNEGINFVIRDANTVGTVASKGKSKAAKAKPKKRNFDLITLSSDEEEEEVDEDEEEDDEDDEVEFLAEMEGHFFGNQDTDASEVAPCFIAYFDEGEFDNNTLIDRLMVVKIQLSRF